MTRFAQAIDAIAIENPGLGIFLRHFEPQKRPVSPADCRVLALQVAPNPKPDGYLLYDADAVALMSDSALTKQLKETALASVKKVSMTREGQRLMHSLWSELEQLRYTDALEAAKQDVQAAIVAIERRGKPHCCAQVHGLRHLAALVEPLGNVDIWTEMKRIAEGCAGENWECRLQRALHRFSHMHPKFRPFGQFTWRRASVPTLRVEERTNPQCLLVNPVWIASRDDEALDQALLDESLTINALNSGGSHACKL